MKKNSMNMARRFLISGLVITSLLVMTPTFAAATEYSPAKFGSAETTLGKMITLPNSFGEGVKTVAVYCQADIMTSGHISNIDCYENSPLVSMQAITQSALTSATFEPATIDGKAVPVRMQFRVIYSLTNTQAPITMVPNLGTLQAKYGTHYIAPQERLDKNDWYVHYTTKNHGDGKLFFADSKITRIMANVEANGMIESVSTIEAANRRKADAEQIEAALKKSRFIPGFVENKPTPMHYIAVVNYKK